MTLLPLSGSGGLEATPDNSFTTATVTPKAAPTVIHNTSAVCITRDMLASPHYPADPSYTTLMEKSSDNHRYITTIQKMKRTQLNLFSPPSRQPLPPHVLLLLLLLLMLLEAFQLLNDYMLAYLVLTTLPMLYLLSMLCSVTSRRSPTLKFSGLLTTFPAIPSTLSLS